MNDYSFSLTFTLPEGQDDPERYIDALYEAGCDDAVVGTGLAGSVSLEFSRQAHSAVAAVDSAIKDVMHAIPGAEMIEARPDLVGLSDIADILQCSRQNIRKYMLNYKNFPRPVHSGKPQLWHLWELAGFPKFMLPQTVSDIALSTFRLNLDIQKQKLKNIQGDKINVA